MPPTKSPISISATSGKLCKAWIAAFAGGSGNVYDSHRPCDIDPATNTVNPCSAGIGHDNPCGAEDRQPTDDSEAWVQCALRQRLTMRNGQFHYDIARRVITSAYLANSAADHVLRHRIDRGLAGWQKQTRTGDHTYTGSRAKLDARALCTTTECREYQHPVRYIQVVVGILDDTCPCAAAVTTRLRQHKRNTLAARQRDFHRVVKIPRQQRRIGRFSRRRSTSASCSPASQRSSRFHVSGYMGTWLASHRSRLPV